jgi:peptidoglycan/LPS O-acetylase OafA/YrhL
MYSALINRSLKIIWTIAAIAYILTILPGFSYVLFQTSPLDGTKLIFYQMPIFRLPEFVLGITLCILLTRLKPKVPYPGLLSITSALCILAYLGYMGSKLPIYVCHNLFIIPFMAFIIIGLSQLKEGPIYKVLSSRPMVFLGNASYSFYLFQAVIILPTVKFHDQIIESLPILGDNHVLFMSVLMPLILISSLSHKYIEKPMQSYINNRLLNVKLKISCESVEEPKP